MGLGRLEETCAALVQAGRPETTPAGVLSRATLPDERAVWGTLADVAKRTRDAGLEAPALLVVGESVGRRVESPAPPGEREPWCASIHSF
jgi:siroheme synthase